MQEIEIDGYHRFSPLDFDLHEAHNLDCEIAIITMQARFVLLIISFLYISAVAYGQNSTTNGTKTLTLQDLQDQITALKTFVVINLKKSN